MKRPVPFGSSLFAVADDPDDDEDIDEVDEVDEDLLPQKKSTRKKEETLPKKTGNFRFTLLSSIPSHSFLRRNRHDQSNRYEFFTNSDTSPTESSRSVAVLALSSQTASSFHLVTTSEPAKKKPNAPLGFPTSKIVIPTSQASRVGLSRKSAAIKPLHATMNQRTVHE